MAPVNLISLLKENDEECILYGVAILPIQNRPDVMSKAIEVLEIIQSAGYPVLLDSIGTVGRRYHRYEKMIHVTVDWDTIRDNTVAFKDEKGEWIRLPVGAEKKYDCSVLKPEDVEPFRAYLNDPTAISKDAAQGAIRAKKLAEKLGLDYL